MIDLLFTQHKHRAIFLLFILIYYFRKAVAAGGQHGNSNSSVDACLYNQMQTKQKQQTTLC